MNPPTVERLTVQLLEEIDSAGCANNSRLAFLNEAVASGSLSTATRGRASSWLVLYGFVSAPSPAPEYLLRLTEALPHLPVRVRTTWAERLLHAAGIALALAERNPVVGATLSALFIALVPSVVQSRRMLYRALLQLAHDRPSFWKDVDSLSAFLCTALTNPTGAAVFPVSDDLLDEGIVLAEKLAKRATRGLWKAISECAQKWPLDARRHWWVISHFIEPGAVRSLVRSMRGWRHACQVPACTAAKPRNLSGPERALIGRQGGTE